MENQMGRPPLSDKNLKLLYEENGRMLQTILEWRHKIMLRFFISVGALGFALKWLLENDSGLAFAWIPFFAAGLLALVSVAMDTANHTVVRDTFKVGSEIEKVLTKGQLNGFYSESLGAYYLRKGIRYTTVFRWFYSFSALLFFMASVYLLLKY
jgi:hypothetical protein